MEKLGQLKSSCVRQVREREGFQPRSVSSSHFEAGERGGHGPHYKSQQMSRLQEISHEVKITKALNHSDFMKLFEMLKTEETP